MILLLLLALVVAAVVVVGALVWREVRVFRSAVQDPPATLEGGGSHLTTRKGS
ncbi:MAG TPA: hypothetical protein VGN13_05395 [Solirubrobacteraceae bacterium]|jgi:hypothetical protein